MIKDLKNVCSPKIFENIFNSYSKDVKRFIFFITFKNYIRYCIQ